MKLTRSIAVRLAALIALWVLVWTTPADAGPIRVLAATQVRIDPLVRPDRSAVEVTVTVLDDGVSPRPVRGRVSLRWTRDSATGPRPPDGQAETDRAGRATFTLPVTAVDDAVRVQAEFIGTNVYAASQTGEQLIDLNAAFVRLDQPQVDPIIDASASSFTVRVHIDIAVRLENATQLAITLLADDVELATVRPDASEYATFVVPVARVREPGFHTLRAEYSRGDNRVSSPARRFVVRAATSIELERAPLQGPSGTTLLGAVATARGPVGAGAAVTIQQGSTLLGAGLTNDRGLVEITLDPETAARPDLVVRARFDPTEPWYLPCESAPLRLTALAPARVAWTAVAVPLACAGVVLLALRWRRRRRDVAAPVAMKPLDDGATVERVSVAPPGSVRVRLRAVDRATELPVEGARARWIRPPRGDCGADELIEIDGVGRFELELRADGYAPRVVTGELPRGGEYSVRVALRSWREELFERVRRWMRQAGAASHPVLPTPREVLAARGASARNEALVSLVEAGTYGPDAPDADVVRAADALAASPSNAPAADADPPAVEAP